MRRPDFGGVSGSGCSRPSRLLVSCTEVVASTRDSCRTGSPVWSDYEDGCSAVCSSEVQGLMTKRNILSDKFIIGMGIR